MTMSRSRALVTVVAAMTAATLLQGAEGFDHSYRAYGELLQRHVRGAGVDYAALKADRAALDRVVAAFDSEATRGEPEWPRDQRMAFWINAYNAFTLRAIVDHYPIRSSWFTLQPRNSIRQIEGVWTELTWKAGGRAVTLDDIEHGILRPKFGDARIHFAVNCASISCPPLAPEPYVAPVLDRQLDAAARAYLAGAEGVRVDGDTLRVTSLFDWYGEDFIGQYAPLVAGERPAKERAILGTIVAFGSEPAKSLAATGRPRIRFIDYNWGLNDAARQADR